METPTIKRVKSKDGNYVWQVTYANGKMIEHSQAWQALIYYHQAMECYQRDAGSLSTLQLSQDSILDAASTSPIIPSAPSDDYAPSSMEKD
jgi:hypothetical protein